VSATTIAKRSNTFLQSYRHVPTSALALRPVRDDNQLLRTRAEEACGHTLRRHKYRERLRHTATPSISTAVSMALTKRSERLALVPACNGIPCSSVGVTYGTNSTAQLAAPAAHLWTTSVRGSEGCTKGGCSTQSKVWSTHISHDDLRCRGPPPRHLGGADTGLPISRRTSSGTRSGLCCVLVCG